VAEKQAPAAFDESHSTHPPTPGITHPTGPAWQRYFGVLKYGDLRAVWLAQAVSQIGDGMMTVGLVWFTLKLTGSPVSLGSILVASTLPYLFGIFTGAFVDRWERIVTMLASDVSRGVIVLLIPLLNAVTSIHVWELGVMSFLLGLAGQFFDPAKAALTPSLVPAEELVRANALLSVTRQVLFVAGPAIGGSMIALAGVLGVFYLDAASFFGSGIILLWLMRSGKRERRIEAASPSSGDILRDIRDGFRYIMHRRTLQVVIAIAALLNFLLSPLPLLVPLYIKQVVKSGALQFGSLTSVIFVGFLIGAVIVALLGNRLGKGRLAGTAIVGAGLASAGFALGLPLGMTMLIGMFGGACIGISNISAMTIVQEQSTDEFRGRVYAFYDSLAQMGRPLSLVAGGVLADAFGVRLVFLLIGVLTVVAGAPILAVRTLRRTP
jgi:DHA3 family macrolide efflux protein-like MFS transporter